MLRKHWPAADTLDGLFVAHYPQMVAWARQLVGRDRQAADDLVHDAYVRVALRNPDVGAIRSFESYLFVTLRNVHLSQVRRNALVRSETVLLVDCETAEVCLRRAIADNARESAIEELWRIAQYACQRKPTSKAASTLVLRFFHGYYPTEIARLVQTTESAVDTRLRVARAEVEAYLDHPDRLRVMGASAPVARPRRCHPTQTSSDRCVRRSSTPASAPAGPARRSSGCIQAAGADSRSTPAILRTW